MKYYILGMFCLVLSVGIWWLQLPESGGLAIKDCNFSDDCEIFDYEYTDWSKEPNAPCLCIVWDGNEIELVPGPNGVTMEGKDIPRVLYNSITEYFENQERIRERDRKFNNGLLDDIETIRKELEQ